MSAFLWLPSPLFALFYWRAFWLGRNDLVVPPSRTLIASAARGLPFLPSSFFAFLFLVRALSKHKDFFICFGFSSPTLVGPSLAHSFFPFYLASFWPRPRIVVLAIENLAARLSLRNLFSTKSLGVYIVACRKLDTGWGVNTILLSPSRGPPRCSTPFFPVTRSHMFAPPRFLSGGSPLHFPIGWYQDTPWVVLPNPPFATFPLSFLVFSPLQPW